jgi:hypothetical protein
MGSPLAAMALRAVCALFSGQVLQDFPRTEQRIAPTGYIITRDQTIRFPIYTFSEGETYDTFLDR